MRRYTNRPAHYAAGGLEVIEILRLKLPPAQFEGALRANVIKYLFRYDLKGEPLNDLRKAATYLSWLREFVEAGQITIKETK
jgi:hypothetical protein